MSPREAATNLSYRRFFEVTGLVGVRVEDNRVFDDTHQLILELVANGAVDGLRIDHIDGLADPQAYLQRLRQKVGEACYITVEKFLPAGRNYRRNGRFRVPPAMSLLRLWPKCWWTIARWGISDASGRMQSVSRWICALNCVRRGS